MKNRVLGCMLSPFPQEFLEIKRTPIYIFKNRSRRFEIPGCDQLGEWVFYIGVDIQARLLLEIGYK